MTLHLSIVADVFRNESQAKHAIEALRRAGFAYDQIGIAMRGHEGIDLQSDLQNLGVSHEHASFYAQEVKAGYTVVSVRPDGREQEAHEIMQRSGAFTDAESAEAQTSTIDKQSMVGDQAGAPPQAYLADQHASNMQQDFHQPRSLKPREERVPVSTQHIQAEEAQVHPALVTEQKPSAASLAQQDEVTEKKSRGAPVVQNVEAIQQKSDAAPVVQNVEAIQQKSDAAPVIQNVEAIQQKSDAAPVVQNDQVDKQLPLVEEVQRETTPIDDEETLHHLTGHAQDRAEMLPPQIQPEQHRNRTLMKNGVLLGSLLLGLSTGVLLVILRREQISQLFLSTAQTIKAQRISVTRKSRDDE